MTDVRSYRFHPLERRGLLLGLQAGQLGTIGTGILGAVVVLRVAPGGLGLLLAVAVIAGTGAMACWPVAGRPFIAWWPLAVSWFVIRRGQVALWAPGAGAAPAPESASGRFGTAPEERRNGPGPKGRRAGTATKASDTGPPGVVVLAAPAAPGEEPIGVVHDRRAGTWSAVMSVSSRPFTLLDAEEKERRLSGWGAILAASARAGSPIHRIQWIERTTAGDEDSLVEYLDRAPTPPAHGPIARAHRSYREVIAGAGPVSRRHEVLVVLSVDPRRVGRALRSFGGRGTPAVCSLLRRELRLLQGQLRTADLRPGPPLDVESLVAALRAGSEPKTRRARGPRGPSAAWPMAMEERWASLHVDGRWHCGYWISEWPRVDVAPDFIAPLLLVGGVRVVSVTMAPVAPDRARRDVESARTANLADDELRRRAGFLNTARQRRESEGALQRESELAEGHGEYRFCAYVSVSAETVDGLEGACAAVEQAALQSHLELRRLYGQQREAFCWTLPLGRGLS